MTLNWGTASEVFGVEGWCWDFWPYTFFIDKAIGFCEVIHSTRATLYKLKNTWQLISTKPTTFPQVRELIGILSSRLLMFSFMNPLKTRNWINSVAFFIFRNWSFPFPYCATVLKLCVMIVWPLNPCKSLPSQFFLQVHWFCINIQWYFYAWSVKSICSWNCLLDISQQLHASPRSSSKYLAINCCLRVRFACRSL